jgi:plasmid maintenance system antidote protein VapI
LPHFGEYITELMDEQGITRTELAEKIDLSEYEIAKLQKQFCCYTPHANIELAKGLNHSVAEMLKIGGCIDTYQDEKHVEWVFEKLNFSKNLSDAFHTVSVDEYDEDAINEHHRIIQEIHEKADKRNH